MLTSKSKRAPSLGRPSRFGDEGEERESSSWSGHGASASLDPAEPSPNDHSHHGAPPVRLLRTVDDKPTAPKLKDFFPRETRSIERVIAFWDSGNTWPADALADLALPGVAAYGATRLIHTESQRSFALIRHTLIDDAQGRLCAVLHVEASANELASADVALMLLERSDHAVVLTGSAEHRELPRRLQDFCRQAAWRGPTLQFISPPDKPSRADRLRKITWPRSLRVQVLELAPHSKPGWLVAVLEKVAEGSQFPSVRRAAAHAEPATVFDEELPPPQVPSEPLPQRPSADACARALQVIAITPGWAGAAVIDFYAQATLAGEGSDTDASVRSALHRWHERTVDTPGPLPTELAWEHGALQHVVLPVDAHPGLLLLGVVEREAGDLARARWQLGVARQEFF